MNKVSIKLNDAGAIVTAFEGNPEFGYIVLESVEAVMQKGWIDRKSRSTLMRGPVSMLEESFSAGDKLAGKIAVIECVEGNIPSTLVYQLDKNKTVEQQIAGFIKRAGKDGPILMSEGKRILRFTEYDASGTQADVRVQHDNVEEIVAHNAKADSKDAKLPS